MRALGITLIAVVLCVAAAAWLPQVAVLPGLAAVAAAGSAALLAELPGRGQTPRPDSRQARGNSGHDHSPELAELRESLVSSQVRQVDAILRLGPTLAEVAAERLATHGLTLEEGKELVDATTWALIRPDRALPEDRRSTGPTFADLDLIISQLEAL